MRGSSLAVDIEVCNFKRLLCYILRPVCISSTFYRVPTEQEHQRDMDIMEEDLH